MKTMKNSRSNPDEEYHESMINSYILLTEKNFINL